ncbi:Diuretic hormone receptor [Dufourea novaeangliae]|uniref:Diuretic hormone receptor n=1 Tax=Dufourea novaeangliae TaxID=178035 RepID=A0A154PCK2_DUFNO|nr:Diuretic hormone receptor [Dufourea novaeangliae]
MAWQQSNETLFDTGNYVLNALNYINKLNESLNTEAIKCLELRHREELEWLSLGREGEEEADRLGCEINWDSLLCWPRTPPGRLATLSCLEELNGIRYDSTQNASRWCRLDGTWSNYSNYSLCRDVREPAIEGGSEVVSTTIYFVGYSLSLFTLIVAVSIFLYCKELRCIKNNIHTNLMFTYILADLMWILNNVMQVNTPRGVPFLLSCLVWKAYFRLTCITISFSIQRLYLFLLVVKTFTADNIKLRLCIVIGWGMPILFIAVWGIAKSLDHSIMAQPNQEVALGKHCPWMVSHPYDWFYQAPAMLVLCVNVLFLFMIMWVLITKLWSATNAETQQYRKASKALLVLIPLLGVTYVLVLMGPTEGQVANAFSYTRAVLLSSQGLFVALFYCFLNTEVQNAVRHHIVRWTTERDLDTERRLYCPPSNPYRKRDSSVSESTTTTVVGMNSTTTFLDKSKKAISEDLNE